MKKLVLMTALMIFGLIFNLTADAQGKKIGMKRAREIASEQAKGKIKSSELEKENGKWIYSFDVRNAKGTITEVNIDAYTGTVISVEEENAQKEPDEKRQEKMEKKKN
jgi:Peptidase propeptide and YPEB domain